MGVKLKSKYVEANTKYTAICTYGEASQTRVKKNSMVIFRFLFNNTPEKNIEKGRPIQLSKKSTCRISK